MLKCLSLAKVLLRELGGVFEIKFGKKGGSKAGVAIFIFVGVCMLPLLGAFYAMFLSLYEILQPAGELAYGTGTILNLASVVIFFFSIMSAPGIYYFSRDVEYLLPLPLRPAQIIGAKFLVTLLIEYVVCLFIVGPMYAAYLSHLPAAALTLNSIIVFVTLPVAPLAYSTLIIMVFMRVFKFGRSRDAYNLLIGLIALTFGLGIGMFSSRLNNVTAEQAMFLIDGSSGTLGALRSIFPATVFAGRAIADGDFVSQLINIFQTAFIALAFFLAANLLYLKSVVGISETGAPSKKMTREELESGTKPRGVFASYVLKEMRLLLRSPVALLNCVMMMFFMPLLLVFTMFVSLGGAEGAELASFLTFDFRDPQTAAYAMAAAAAAGLFISCMNLTTSTSVSREGRNYIFIKYVPVSYRTQLNAKAASGMLVSLAGTVLTLAALQAMLRMPLPVLLGAALLTLPGGVVINYLGLLLDLLKPKLVWDNEQRAVKQNLNAMALMLGGMIIAALVGVAGFLLFQDPVAAFMVLFVILCAFAFAAGRFTLTVGESRLESLGE